MGEKHGDWSSRLWHMTSFFSIKEQHQPFPSHSSLQATKHANKEEKKVKQNDHAATLSLASWTLDSCSF